MKPSVRVPASEVCMSTVWIGPDKSEVSLGLVGCYLNSMSLINFVPVHGILNKRASLFDELLGMTSYDALKKR